ncbi:MAG TPA: catalase family protein [Vicinamibacterales bacterium]|nr:catalase family protein [Vicinamibacterales bacterium]
MTEQLTSAAHAQETIAPDEATLTASFIDFLKSVSAKRHPTGIVRRFNQGRAAGCVEAEFSVPDDVPAVLRVGLFSRGGTYPAWIRFANASSTSDRDKDVRGMAIKVRKVPGTNLTPGATTQDFVLNSHPVMPASGVRDFLELLRAMDAGGVRLAWFFLSHPRSARVGLAARQNPTCHLDLPYWSTTPYLFGPGRAVKYAVRPTSSRTSTLPTPLTDTYLRDALAAHLAQGEATFDFMIQFQSDNRTMPIEDAMVEWNERDSPFRTVARIRIPPQAIDTPEREAACEQVAFNPWNCLIDHRPLGGMNRARKEIYRAMAAFRQERSG